MFTVQIDDSQVLKFTRESPQRARWAFSEALKMTGGHLRKKIRWFIERGGAGWPALTRVSKKKGGHGSSTPLHFLGRFVRFKYGRYKGQQRVRIGFLSDRKVNARARKAFGMTLQALARLHEYGKRRRVTPAMRRKLAAMGYPVKKNTKTIEIPKRPMIEPIWRKERNKIPGYLERAFFKKFFSAEKPRIGF